MNKFTEQNKATAKSDPSAKPAKEVIANTPHNGADHKDAGHNGTVNTAAKTDSNGSAKVVAADKAKADVGMQKPADAAKKDAFNGKWQSQIQAAKSNWNKISESELVQSGGVETKLADLVQQRYSLSQDVARKQVKSFIDKCHC
jgi:hypothetical protein